MKIAFAVLLLWNITFIALAQPVSPGKPLVSPEEISKDVMSWVRYDAGHLRLSGDFKAYNQNASLISKDQFLKQLASGSCLPVKLSANDGVLKYQLYKMPVKTESSLKEVIKDYGKRYYNYYKREGQPIPGFNFKDVGGKFYSKLNTKGKIVVLKCWFIACTACVEEMPRLNQVVDQYKNRKDVVFISLAFDSKKKLDVFLKKTKFSYAVVPDQESYMRDQLQVNSYPTHLIVNKKGRIAKVVNNAEDMIRALNKESAL